MRKKIVVLAVAALFAIANASQVGALPSGSSGFSYTYYSDAAFTEVVGGRFMECEGYPDSWGQRTQYYELATWSCPPDPPSYTCDRWACSEYYDEYGNLLFWECAKIEACRNN